MRIAITWPIDDSALLKLHEVTPDIVVNTSGQRLSGEGLVDFVANADAVICLLTDVFDRNVIDSLSDVTKVIATMSVGYDHIDVAAAHSRSIVVTNTPGASDNAVAEHTVALMLGLSKSLPSADRFVREGSYHGWDPTLFVGPEMAGKVLGIVGLGRIGSTVARIAGYGLGMAVIYNDVQSNPEFEARYQTRRYELDALLALSDVVSLHVPLVPATHHLIDGDKIGRMKQSAFLINTSRGPVVDEAGLVNALQMRQIAGAGIDVYEFEPNISAQLLAMPNVVLTPHIASATYESRTQMAHQAVNNVVAALRGQIPPDMVREG